MLKNAGLRNTLDQRTSDYFFELALIELLVRIIKGDCKPELTMYVNVQCR